MSDYEENQVMSEEVSNVDENQQEDLPSPPKSRRRNRQNFATQQPEPEFNPQFTLTPTSQENRPIDNSPSLTSSDKKNEQEEDKSSSQPHSESIEIKAVDAENCEMRFKIRPNTPLKKLMAAYCAQKCIDINSLRFAFNGDRVQGTDTPKNLEMQDGDIIDVMISQVGG